MTEEKVILKIKEIMVCNPYRGTYVMRKENISFLAADLVKLFAIPAVSKERELLIALLDWGTEEKMSLTEKTNTEIVDMYLKSNL